jgi:hypothetical protein
VTHEAFAAAAGPVLDQPHAPVTHLGIDEHRRGRPQWEINQETGPARPGIGAVRLTVAETARLIRLARQYAAGRITRARLAFHLRWWRRRHQARVRWHHYATRLAAEAAI